MNIFIIGPSGCGKSTQAKLIAEKYGLTHLSMGQLLRDEIAAKTALGLEAQSYVDQGQWAPNELVFRILTANLEKFNNENLIVDGFPRQVDQMKDMDQYFAEKSKTADLIIHLDVTTQEIIDRRHKVAQAGGVFQEARNDETPQAIASRQKSYDESIGPIFEYLNQDARLFRVNGNRPIEPIFADISVALDNIK